MCVCERVGERVCLCEWESVCVSGRESVSWRDSLCVCE